ncbi:MAG: hypothetical protein RLZ87_498 [Armatimonadota bacterium]
MLKASFRTIKMLTSFTFVSGVCVCNATPDWKRFFSLDSVSGQYSISKSQKTSSVVPSTGVSGNSSRIQQNPSDSISKGKFSSGPEGVWNIKEKDNGLDFSAIYKDTILFGFLSNDPDFPQRAGGVYGSDLPIEPLGLPHGHPVSKVGFFGRHDSLASLMSTFRWEEPTEKNGQRIYSGSLRLQTGVKPAFTAVILEDVKTSRLRSIQIQDDKNTPGFSYLERTEFEFDEKSPILFPVKWNWMFEYKESASLGNGKWSDPVVQAESSTIKVDKLVVQPYKLVFPFKDGYVFWKIGRKPPTLVLNNGTLDSIDSVPTPERPKSYVLYYSLFGCALCVSFLIVMLIRRRKSSIV